MFCIRHSPSITLLCKMLHVLENVQWFGYIVNYIDKGNIWKRSILIWGGSFYITFVKFGIYVYFCMLNRLLGSVKLKKNVQNFQNGFKSKMATKWPPYWNVWYFEDVIGRNQLDTIQQSIQNEKISLHAKFYKCNMETPTPIEFSNKSLVYKD